MDANGSRATDSVRVTVEAPPEVVITQINDNTWQASIAGSSYHWLLDGKPLPSTFNSQSITPVESGDYTVAVTVNGCETERSAPITIVIVGIRDVLIDASLKIYPNPSSGIFYFQTDWEESGVMDLSIMDAKGRILKVWQDKPVGQVPQPIDMTAYPAGIYWLRIRQNTRSVFRKLSLVKN